ncbi:MAG TPA: hypothetical protein VLH41_07975, partial [Thermoanaerobaculia bacterium]|nr:hypothetical protein [Thermoanaerobaculia bacterium]
MSPKARRVIVVTLLVAGTIVLVVGGAAVWVLGTESGSRFAFERLGSLLEGSLEVESLHGPLRGPLVVEGLVYRTPGLTVTVRRAELRWRLSRLIRKQLDITSLTASGVRVTSTPTEDRKASEALPDVHLPVNVIVRSAEITDLTIGPGSPDPFVVDRISLATRSIGELVRIERLAVRSPRIDADASGSVRPQGEYPVDLEIRWNAPLRGETWRGRGTVSGSLDRLVVRHDLAQPFSAHLVATLTKPLRDLSFDGSIETEGVELAKLDPSLPAARISGTVHAAGSIERFLATGSVAARLEGGPVGAARATFRLGRSDDVWTIASARLGVPGRPDTVSVSGSVVAVEPPRFDLSAQWSDVSWPISGTPVVRSPRGRLRLAGSLADYGLEGSADFVSSTVGSGRASLEGRGSAEALTLTRLEADVAGGSVHSAGRIAWKPAVAWDLTLEARDIDPASVSAKWPGAIDLVARTSGRRTESGLRGRLDVTRIGGNLRGFPVSGEATVVAAGERYGIERLAVSVGSGRLTASGTAGKRLDVRFDAAAGDLGDLLPEAGGSLHARGKVRGTSEAPRIEAAIDGRALLWKDVTVSRLEGSGVADFRPGGPIRATLDARKLEARGRSFDLVSLRVRGTREAHGVDAALNGDRLNLVFAARGGLSDRTWTGTLSKLDLDSREIGRWTLAQPARLSAGPTGGRIEGFCWTSSDGRLCADAGWNERRATVAGTLSNLPLDLLEPLVPASVDLSGRLDGKVDLERLSDGRLEADVRLATSATSVSWANEKGVRVERRIEKATLEGRAGSEGARATLALRLGGGGSLDGFVELPRYGDRSLPVRSQPLRARLQADLADVGFLQAFFPDIDRLAGSFAADVTVGGTPATPTFSGRAALEDGRARLQRLGITVTGARVTASGRGGGPLAIEGRLESGGGSLTVTGTLTPGADQ